MIALGMILLFVLGFNAAAIPEDFVEITVRVAMVPPEERARYSPRRRGPVRTETSGVGPTAEPEARPRRAPGSSRMGRSEGYTSRGDGGLALRARLEN